MSTANDLYRELSDLGAMLWQEGRQLRYRAPHGSLTPELLARMRAHKAGLLALLSANDPAPAPATTQRLILTYEVAGRTATYIDPDNEPLEVAVAILTRTHGQRLGRVWCRGVLVREAKH